MSIFIIQAVQLGKGTKRKVFPWWKADKIIITVTCGELVFSVRGADA
jgi:hypothetical protein